MSTHNRRTNRKHLVLAATLAAGVFATQSVLAFGSHGAEGKGKDSHANEHEHHHGSDGHANEHAHHHGDDEHANEHEHHHGDDGHANEHAHHHGDDGHANEHEHHHVAMDKHHHDE
ncbi:MAG: hypothetical protein V2I66_01235 [Halieaceae bacterium]|nr:hypothetical protein [Halieaceae bacterium]